MGFIAPKERKHLSADALFGFVRSLFATVPDDRRDETAMPLADALMAGCAMFSRTCPSLLDFDTQRAEGNVQTIYGIARAPCDSSMRERLDPVAPASLRPVFTGVFRQLQRGKALEEMVFFTGCSVLALDGTGYFASKTMPGQSCLDKHHRDGSIPSAHQLLGAALVHPDRRAVLPLRPEAMITHDGSENNDGERQAAQRFIATLRHDHPPLGCIVTDEGLSANAPHIDTLHDAGCHALLGVQEGDPGSLFKQVHAAEHAGRVRHDARHDRAAGIAHRLRWSNDLPLNASRPDVRVNCIEYWEVSQDHGQYLSWVTDFRVHKDNVDKLMRGGRARWKREHATCNTLKNQGDNFDHTSGHGAPNLSVVLAVLMMLAFLVDQTQQRCCALLRAVWETLGSKRLLWERMRALFCA